MKQIVGLVTLILLGITIYVNNDKLIMKEEFENWKNFNHKYYSSVEEQYRRMIFEQNKIMIEKHNLDPESTYKMDINQFSDLTKDEFIAIYMSSPFFEGLEMKQQNTQSYSTSNESFDWRNTTKVRDMKNGCSSSWAFSAVAAAESYLYVIKSQNQTLSVQQLLDCDQKSSSCEGGLPNSGLEYIAQNGAYFESAYPYTGKASFCKREQGGIFINASENVKDLKSALRKYAVSILVDASNWQFYQSGIFSNCQNQVNFAATAVGFNDQYWIVQSSFGTQWGQNGYIYLAPGNTCGIQSYLYRAI